MSQVERISVEALMLEIDPHLEIAMKISQELGSRALDATQLVYCGIEGEGLTEVRCTEELGDRASTFAVSWESLIEQARQHDHYGQSTLRTSPFEYANWAMEQPAIITYQADQLFEDMCRGDNFWVPKTGNSVSPAARALIFFE